ncbi:MBL fold metallo-hydrolase [Crocosphaera sp. UHCC 0190]|uniref:MBL fold metallo-hydrolase n=1 Tax=Crocosphaera sp. UHCC 0190 TaxID=3110246 RepID=UPI002B1F21A6|nr:MBL fold metallo-hydrolase [Crocosphaera sp. UHCC 0190]MEA5510754.1 MBL fold metallo-hydrolase [Crocosphaera sp. UHCC 0190]
MATLQKRRSENMNGNFYVDSTCIDCDTCRWMAPEVFHRDNNQSAVYHQPTNKNEELEAFQALLSCPTASIGTVEKPNNIKQIQQNFPLLVDENIYHCGYHSEKSFGAASYFIQRQEGNILIDSPRFSPPLVKQIEAMGGIHYLYLTHKDDVADHEKFAQHFGCQRILHVDDINEKTQGVEIQLSGNEPIELSPDFLIIPVPGHTKGHTVLLYQQKYLFTGDHLAWSSSLNHLCGFHHVCWYNWSEQIISMKNLAHYSFEWILPGHGRRYHSDQETMKQQMQQCISWMMEQT